MSCHYVLSKNKTYLDDYSIKKKFKYDFSVSGKMLEKYPSIDFENILNKLDSYSSKKETEKLEETLKNKVAVKNKEIVLGCGANGILQNLINCFFNDKKDNLVTPFYTFNQAVYAVNSKNMKAKLVLHNDDFSINIENLKKSVDRHTKAVFLANPNNPTGLYLDARKIIDFAKELTIPVIVSEAAIMFAEGESLLDYESLPNNLIVLRSFSKEYGLAGLRLGYAFMSNEYKKLYLEKTPTNEVSLVSVIVLNSVIDDPCVLKNIKTVKKNRDELFEMFGKLGLSCVKSNSNIIMITNLANKVIDELENNDIGVTIVDGQNGEKFVRIAVQERKTNLILIDVLKNLKESHYENFLSN